MHLPLYQLSPPCVLAEKGHAPIALSTLISLVELHSHLRRTACHRRQYPHLSTLGVSVDGQSAVTFEENAAVVAKHHYIRPVRSMRRARTCRRVSNSRTQQQRRHYQCMANVPGATIPRTHVSQPLHASSLVHTAAALAHTHTVRTLVSAGHLESGKRIQRTGCQQARCVKGCGRTI